MIIFYLVVAFTIFLIIGSIIRGVERAKATQNINEMVKIMKKIDESEK